MDYSDQDQKLEEPVRNFGPISGKLNRKSKPLYKAKLVL